MEEHEKGKKKPTKLETHGIRQKNQPLLQNMNIPSDLNTIQPRATQVWNCDEIGFSTNGR